MPAVLEMDRTLTLVFTDLAGSTALKVERGDRVVEDLMSVHRSLVEYTAADTGGRVVKWMGDGCFLTFETPSAATTFGLRLQMRHGAEAELPPVRVGVHMGEVTETRSDGETPDVHGFAVDLAARIGALASPGQVLLSGQVFDNVRQRLRGDAVGAEIAWRAHGSYELKGVADCIDICEAGIEGSSPLRPPDGGDRAHRAVTPGEEDTLGWRPAIGLVVPRRDHWVLEQQLGEGGFGEVWLAVHTKTKTKRVFKFCFEPDRIKGLKREVVLFRLLKESLGHRDDIAQILDWDFEHSPYFIESEYTEGGDLAEWAEAKGGLGAVPLATRLELVAQTAVALGSAHSVGVLHKDIKPSNILVSEVAGKDKPRISLTDFGIGLITDPAALAARGITAAGLTQTLISSSTPSSGAGTHMYMAPEIIEGRPATTLSDVYALGVLLYQIVVADFGRALAPGWERDIDDPLLAEDIAACIDGNPDLRLASAGELAARLRALDSRREAKRADERRIHGMERAQRRKKILTATAAAGVALVFVFGAFAVRENQRARDFARLAENEKAARIQTEIARREAVRARSAESKLRAEAEYAKYLSDLDLVEQALSAGDLPGAQRRLAATPRELRGWEWGYFWEKAFPAAEGVDESERGAPATAAEHWFGAEAKSVGALAGHEGNAYYVSFSPDGSKMATRSRAGELFFWDAATLERTHSFTVPVESAANDHAFDPSGEFLAINVTGGVQLYDAAGQGHLQSFAVSGGESLGGLFEFSPDGSLLLTAAASGSVFAWDWRSLEHKWSVQTTPGFSSDAWTGRIRVGYTPDHKGFVFAEDRTTLAIGSLHTGEVLDRIVPDVPAGYSAVEFATHHGRIAYYNPEEKAYLFVAFPSGEPMGDPWIDPLEANFASVASSPDGTLVAIRNDSNTVQLLEVGGSVPNVLVSAITGVSRPQTSHKLTFSPDGRLLAAPQADNTFMIFAPQKNKTGLRRNVYAHNDSVSAARFMGSDDRLVTAAFDGTIRVWDLRRGRMSREIQAHAEGIAMLSVSADHSRWITYAFDGTVAVWDGATGDRLFSSPTGPSGSYAGGFRGPLVRVSLPTLDQPRFNPAHNRVVLPGPAGSALLTDAASFEERAVLGGHAGYVNRSEFSPNGAYAVTTAYPEPAARLWDAATGTLLHVLEGGTQVICTDFSPDSKRLVLSHVDGRITLWNTTTGEQIRNRKEHQNAVMTVRYDNAGKQLLTASTDGTAAVWNTDTWVITARCSGHSGFVVGAFFNPANDRILTLGFDKTARIWDLLGNELAVVDTGENILNGEWSPSGRRIAVTTIEGHVFVYESIPAAEIAAADQGGALREHVAAWRNGK